MPRAKAPEELLPSVITRKAPNISELDAEAQKLFDEIEQQWQLNPPCRAILTLICQQMTLARACTKIAEAEGLSCFDNKGSVKVHPLLHQAHQCRNSASSSLQRLLTNLG